MPISQIVAFCNNLYQKNGKCGACLCSCTNRCDICLQEIHHDQSNLRQYDCDNMVSCYVCSYINKYASEIYYALSALVNHSSTKKVNYDILSVGCGDCADLFGIQRFLDVNHRNINISYTGVDINEKWKPIHQYISTLFPHFSFHYEYDDIFNYMNSLEIVPFNIVILEYVLNEIRKYTPEKIDSFIEDFVHQIIDRLPSGSLIIVNDINHKMVRDYYSTIKTMADENNSVQQLYLRFANPTTHTYGGSMLQNDSLVFNIADNNFEEKSPCTSCIYILHKQ